LLFSVSPPSGNCGVNAFADDFERHGVEVIAKVRGEQPAQYLNIAADLLPKEAALDIDANVFAEVRGVRSGEDRSGRHVRYWVMHRP
jgi:hypothetical protein